MIKVIGKLVERGMIFQNRYSNQQVLVDRLENGFVFYCPLDGGTTGWYVTFDAFMKYHQIYCGSII